MQKGEASPDQTVRTEASGASCGLELGGRGPYLVFALSEVDPSSRIELGRGELYSGLCSGTRAIAVGGLRPAVGRDDHRVVGRHRGETRAAYPRRGGRPDGETPGPDHLGRDGGTAARRQDRPAAGPWDDVREQTPSSF